MRVFNRIAFIQGSDNSSFPQEASYDISIHSTKRHNVLSAFTAIQKFFFLCGCIDKNVSIFFGSEEIKKGR